MQVLQMYKNGKLVDNLEQLITAIPKRIKRVYNHKEGTVTIYQVGDVIPSTTFELTPEQIIQQIQAAIMDRVQNYMDSFASELYDDMKTAASWKGSSIPIFDKEGTYCFEMRDLIWITLFSKQEEIILKYIGQINELTIQELVELVWEDVIKILPVLAWPEGSRGYKG